MTEAKPPELFELYPDDVVALIKSGMVELPCALHLYSLEVEPPALATLSLPDFQGVG